MPGLIIIPTHTKWKALKKKYDVADGAVSGINVGKALDTYETKEKAGVQYAKANAAAAAELEAVLAKYITKLDKSKVKKDYSGFQRTFLNDYVGAAKEKSEDFKRYAADAETYTKELLKFFASVQRMEPGKTTVDNLSKFKSGPLRGLSAVGSSLKGFDLSEIDKRAAKIQQVIDKLPTNSDQALIDRVLQAIIKTGEEMAAEAKKLGLM